MLLGRSPLPLIFCLFLLPPSPVPPGISGTFYTLDGKERTTREQPRPILLIYMVDCGDTDKFFKKEKWEDVCQSKVL